MKSLSAMQAPLSYQQQEMLENAIAHRGAVGRNHNICLYRLEGLPDPDILIGALSDLVARHPALRTVLTVADDRIVQSILPTGLITQVSYDDEVGGSAPALVDKLESQRYDLSDILAGRPLFTAQVHERESAIFLSIVINHLIFDGWSMGIICRDLTELYSARLERREARLPELGDSYADYATEHRAVTRDRVNEAIRFYQRQLGDCTEGIRWPQPGEPGVKDPTEASREHIEITGARASVIGRISQAARVSPFTVLMAATSMAILRISEQDELLVAVDTANRVDPRFADAIGFFVNTRFVAIPRADDGDALLNVVRRIRTPWHLTAQYDDVYCTQVMSGLGIWEFTRIDMPSLHSDWTADLAIRLPGATVTEVETPMRMNYWRDICVTWVPRDGSYLCNFLHRKAAVSSVTARRICAEIETVLEEASRLVY
jgi:hypothetical protein